MLAYFIITFLMHKVGLDPIIKLGKWLARIHCICAVLQWNNAAASKK